MKLSSDITTSAPMKQKFLSQFPHLKESSQLIPNPLLETFSGRRPRKMSSPFKFGVMGRLEKVKGVDAFLMAASHVCKSAPDAEFHIYGEGSQEEYLKIMATRLDITKVFFHGYTIKPLSSMSQLDCLVVPSKEESFGLSALEALSVGTPVIAFQETGIADFLKHGKHGYLAQKGNCVVVIPNIEKNLLTPLTEAYQAVVWHFFTDNFDDFGAEQQQAYDNPNRTNT